MMRLADRAIRADEAHRDAAVLARDVENDLVAAEPHRAPSLALDRPADHLPGNLPLALAEHVIDRRAHGGEPSRDLAFGRTRGKTFRKFLRDEAGGQVTLAPARMIHQCRQERNVVADAIDIERIERGRLR